MEIHNEWSALTEEDKAQHQAKVNWTYAWCADEASVKKMNTQKLPDEKAIGPAGDNNN